MTKSGPVEPLPRIRDLGPLLVERAAQVRPVSGALAAVLTLLLVRAGEAVSGDAVAQAVWPDGERRSASTVASHLSRLRSVLGPADDGGPVLRRSGGGLTLVLPAERIDSRRFERSVDQVRASLRNGDPQSAVDHAREAAALWRGRPYAPLSDEPWVAPAVARLEETYAQLREQVLEALLAIGDPERVLIELRTEIPAHSLRERLWTLRMIAEYRTGRLDDALRTFHEARRLFRDELGVEPPAALSDLQARMLARDPALLGSPTVVDGARTPPSATDAEPVTRAAGAGRRSGLPHRRGRLIGRTALVDTVQALVRGHRLVTLAGAAGCGKTRLAVEVAHAVVGEFADGVWWVDLTAARTADQVVDAVASTIGIAPRSTGTASDALVTYARDRQLLLVLDNCEQVLAPAARLVDDLLNAGDGVSVVATTREPLSLAVEVVRAVPPLSVDAVSGHGTAPAVELFVERLGTATDARLSDADAELVATICRAVDGLPLAVELAAARATAYSLAEIAEQAASDPSSLSRIGRGGADHHRTVRYAVEQTYRALPAAEAALHRAVAVVPGPFTTRLAGALDELPADETVALVASLVHRSMLVPLGPSAPGRPSRFTQLATVRGHAGHASVNRRDLLVARRDAWVRDLIDGRPRLGRPAERAWLAAVDDDLAAVRASLEHLLVGSPDPRSIGTVAGLGMYWYNRGMLIEGTGWTDRAVGLVDRATAADRAAVHLAAAAARILAQRVDAARPHLEAGLWAVRETSGRADVRLGESLAALLGPLSLVRAEALLRRCTARLRELANRSADPGLALLTDLGSMLVDQASTVPRPQVALQAAAVWDRAQELDDHFTSRLAAGTSAILALGARRLSDALLWSDRQIAAHVALGLTEGPVVLEVRANLLAELGDAAGALRLYAAGQAHHRRAGLPWPQQPWTSDLRRSAAGRLTPAQAETATRAGASLTLLDIPRGEHPPADP